MKTNDKFLKKNIIKSIIALVVVILLAIFLRKGQNEFSKQHQYKDSLSALQCISNAINSNESSAAALEQTFHNVNTDILDDLKNLMLLDSPEEIFDEITDKTFAKLSGLFGRSFASHLFLIDEDGKIILSVNEVMEGLSLKNTGLFGEGRFEKLITCPKEGVLCGSGHNDHSESDYFYAVPIDFHSKKCFLVIGIKGSTYQKRINSLTGLDKIVKNLSIGEKNVILAINTESGLIEYCSKDSLKMTNEHYWAIDIPESLLESKESKTIRLGGEEYFFVSLRHSDSLVLLSGVSTKARYSANSIPTFWAIVIFVMIFFMALCYMTALRKESHKRDRELIHIFNSKYVVDSRIIRKTLPLMLIFVGLLFGTVFYLRSIIKLSYAMDDVERPLGSLSQQLKENAQEQKHIKEYCNQMYLAKTQMIAALLEMNPSCLNEKNKRVYTNFTDSGEKQHMTDDEGNLLRSVSRSKYLKELSETNEVKSILIFNEYGYAIAASNSNWFFSLSKNPNDQSHAFFDVLAGRFPYLVQDAQVDDQGNMNQYVGISFNYYTTKTNDGETLYVSRRDYEAYQKGRWTGNRITLHQSLLQCCVNTQINETMLKSTDISYLMEHVALTNDGYMVVFDNTPEHKIIYTPNKENIGKEAKQLEITDDEFSGNFCGFQTVNGVKYFECCRYGSGLYVAVATPLKSLFSTRIQYCLFVTLSCTVVMVLILIMFLVSTEDELNQIRDNHKLALKPENPGKMIAEKGTKKPASKILQHLSTIKRMWNKKNAEEKVRIVIHLFILFIGLYFVFCLIDNGSQIADISVIRYVFSNKWSRSVNIFAFTKTLSVIVGVFVFLVLLDWFTNITSFIFSPNVKTVVHLIRSSIKYGTVIAAIFYCLFLYGMKPVSLMASAGVISLVIGLGAQSIISDMLAGIFIVFEGSYHVGDFVNLNGSSLWGMVMEIGIRTTKIKDTEGKILIYRNSSISNIINSSVKEGMIKYIFSISYDESIERVEEIFKTELPLLKEKIPEIIGEPFYFGVYELNDSSIDMRIDVRIRGSDRVIVNAKLNRELWLMCVKYDIKVPYDHITVDIEK